MKNKLLSSFFKFLFLSNFFWQNNSFSSDLDLVFQDLKKNQNLKKKQLPHIYNTHSMTGYLNMPSAYCNEEGYSVIGFSHFYPYQSIGVNFQLFPFLEGAFNYKIFLDKPEDHFGHFGFGDDADRTVNLKLSFDPEIYFGKNLPKLALGFDDFYGSCRFYAPYLVLTQVFPDLGLEASLGYGFHRMRGVFAGVNYSPFLQNRSSFFNGLTFIGEYDDVDYSGNEKEHPRSKTYFSRLNLGVNWGWKNIFDLKIASSRGKELLVQTSLKYNFGNTLGLFPKLDDPNYYSFPKNYEPLGNLRSEREATYSLVDGLFTQGFYATHVFLRTEKDSSLWLQINLINLRYWRNEDVKFRISRVIRSLYPGNLSKVVVTIHEDSIPVESYVFYKNEDKIVLSEAFENPSPYDGKLLFLRKKTLASWLIRPRLLSFFGSTTGKYKYALSLIGGPQGYILDKIYYKLLLSYNIKSSIQNLSDIDFYDPSQLLAVRSDSVKYFQTQTVNLEQAYLQRGWNLGQGLYFRTSFGYFEPAYAGAALEGLYFPINSNFALGIEAATVLKRNYEGLGFQKKIRKLAGLTPTYVPYIGVQYFLDAYYFFKPIDLELKLSLGQFLAKDKGVQLELAKYYKSGLRLGYWMTVTNAGDTVHGKIYYNKGISFRFPLDIFLTKSSRNYVGYSLAFWLRDSGAKAATGKELYPTLIRARDY